MCSVRREACWMIAVCYPLSSEAIDMIVARPNEESHQYLHPQARLHNETEAHLETNREAPSPHRDDKKLDLSSSDTSRWQHVRHVLQSRR